MKESDGYVTVTVWKRQYDTQTGELALCFEELEDCLELSRKAVEENHLKYICEGQQLRIKPAKGYGIASLSSAGVEDIQLIEVQLALPF